MNKFKELFESNTKNKAQKIINKIKFEVLMPQAFEVDIFNTDAGMGGEKVIRVKANNLRSKDHDDVSLLKSTLKNTFTVEDKSENKDSLMLILRDK